MVIRQFFLQEYNVAIVAYTEATKFKKSDDVADKIENVVLLKESKQKYATAVKEMNNNNYLTAIDDFRKVLKYDIKRYSDSENKIIDCKKSYSTINLTSATDSLKKNNIDEASNTINNILKIDKTNVEALKMNKEITNEKKTIYKCKKCYIIFKK